MDDFDRIEGITRRVGRAAAVGLPVWILLLALLPLTGLGVLPCLLGATILAGAVVVLADRRLGAPGRREGGSPPRRRGEPRLSPAAAVALTLAVVAVIAYVILVARAA